MDRLTGSLSAVKSLDADPATGGVEFHILVIEARDSGSAPRSVTGTVKVVLQPANDNPPRFTKPVYEVLVSCDTEPDSEILKLETYDPDGDSDIVFSMSSGVGDFLSVDRSSGSVVFKSFPTFQSSWDLVKTKKVLVSDVNDVNLRDEAYINVIFEDCTSSRNCTAHKPVECVSVAPTTCEEGESNSIHCIIPVNSWMGEYATFML